MRKVSVIVPVYNTQKELGRCLCSIKEQTYKNLEIICIDDGSTDGSEEIVDTFAKEDKRFVVIHQKNMGESSARNAGLKIATGDIIAFCDCDDWIESDTYEALMKEMDQYDLDISAGGWMKETSKGAEKIHNIRPVTEDVFDQLQLLEYLYKRDFYRGMAYMWNKLYKREILKRGGENAILFDESLTLGGDVVFLAKAALNVQKVKYIDRALYHYCQREGSGCHTKDVAKLRDWIRAYEIIIEMFTLRGVDQEIINYTKRFLAYHSSNAAEIALNQGLTDAKNEFQNFMRLYEKEYTELNADYPERIQRYRQLLET